MKNLKYLCLLITLIFSVNSLSNPTVAMSTICDLNRANVESCQNLYDSFLVDLMNQVAAAEKGFDKKKYVEDKLAYYKAELRVLEMFIPKTQKRIGPIVQATQPFAFGAPFDFFTSFQSVLSQLFAGFWSDPDEEQAEVGGNSDYEADINDHKLRIAMYEEVLLTLPAFKTGSYINKYGDYWSIISASSYSGGVTNPKELDAFTLMLQYLKVKRLNVTLAVGFEKTFYYDSLGQFKRSLFFNNSLTDLSLDVKDAEYPQSSSYLSDKLSLLLYGADFAHQLAKKIIRSRLDPKKRTFKNLNISGVANIDEFLKNFYSLDDSATNYFATDLKLNKAFDFVSRYPQLDSLALNSSMANHQSGFLSKESLATINGLLLKGLEILWFDYKIHQETTPEGSPQMLINAFDELTHQRMDKALALKDLTLEGVTEGDAALFVQYLMGSKNNLEKITFLDLPEVGSAALLYALSETYSNKGGDSHMKSEIKLTSLNLTGPGLGPDSIENIQPQDEANMSRFLTSLASSTDAKKLVDLTIQSIGLTEKNIEDLGQGIKHNKYLCPRFIDFSYNKISVDSAWKLAEAIKVGCGDKVNTLYLSGNPEAAKIGLIEQYKAFVDIRY